MFTTLNIFLGVSLLYKFIKLKYTYKIHSVYDFAILDALAWQLTTKVLQLSKKLKTHDKYSSHINYAM